MRSKLRFAPFNQSHHHLNRCACTVWLYEQSCKKIADVQIFYLVSSLFLQKWKIVQTILLCCLPYSCKSLIQPFKLHNITKCEYQKCVMASKCSVTQANEGLRTKYIRYTLWTFVLRMGSPTYRGEAVWQGHPCRKGLKVEGPP